MNESPNLYEPKPDAGQEDLLKSLPLHAFESECQRSLEMIQIYQQYMMRFVEGKDDPDSREISQTLADLSAVAGRLDRNLHTMTALLRCMQHTEAPKWEPLELCAFVRTLCSEQEQIQQTLGVRLTMDCGKLKELYVHADAEYLARICLHLLSNALRACTPEGGKVTISLRSDGKGGGSICITDTGCGLPGSTIRSRQENRRHFLGTTKSSLLLCSEYCNLTGWTLELRPRAKGHGTQALLTIPPLAEFRPIVTLRSFSEEDALRAERQLWLDLTFELSCVPGMELVRFKIPSKYT